MKPRPFAVFDIDGTLIRWQLYHAVADELVREGFIEPRMFEPVLRARMTWKNRGSDASFNDYELTMIRLLDKVINGIQVSDVVQASTQVVARYKDQVYTYTRDQIAKLRAKHYLLFAISGSQADIVKLLAAYYHFDDYGGSEYEVKNGRYTGHKQVLTRERKPEYLRQLVEKHQATWENSIGFGDSESDIPLLSAVSQPIAFNPTKVLFEHATSHHWPIVVERKNMIYRLASGEGRTYELQPDQLTKTKGT